MSKQRYHCDQDQPRGRRARRAAQDDILLGSQALDSDELVELFTYQSPSFWQSWQAFSALPEEAQSALPSTSVSSPAFPLAQKQHTLRNDLLRRIDAPILSLLRQGHAEPLLRSLETSVRSVARLERSELTLVLPTARDRMLAHGVAQFYLLASVSVDDENMPGRKKRVTVIRPRRSQLRRGAKSISPTGRSIQPPDINLSDLVLVDA
jgi:hypothetical protein